jgi:RNA polymerase sigma-70 factor (ECF subfamily)
MPNASGPVGGRQFNGAEDRWLDYVRDIQNGSTDALAKLYDVASSLVYSLALRVVRDPADAEEVLVDVFQQVWRTAKTFNPARGGVWTWLVMLTRSRALDRVRNTAGKRSHELPPLPDTSSVASAEPLPEQASILAQQQTIVWRALRSLSPQQRQVLELAFFHGLTHMEIASQLEIPLGTIKSRIRAAMDKLRGTLQQSMSGTV